MRVGLENDIDFGFAPSQYFDLSRANELRPEQKLCCAVLYNAIQELGDPRPKYRKEAREWICGAPGKFTFDDVCSALRLNVHRVRSLLLVRADAESQPQLPRRPSRRQSYIRARHSDATVVSAVAETPEN
jgi:hypothetical protein